MYKVGNQATIRVFCDYIDKLESLFGTFDQTETWLAKFYDTNLETKLQNYFFSLKKTNFMNASV